MNKGLLVGTILLILGQISYGQTSERQPSLWRTLFSTAPHGAHYSEQMRAWQVGAGGLLLRDHYLSPLNYGGYTLSVIGERSYYGYRRLAVEGQPSLPTFIPSAYRSTDDSWLHRSTMSFDYGTTLSPAGNASIRRLQFRWDRNLTYRVVRSAVGSLFVGGGLTAGLGGLYHSRNGNNPATAKMDLGLTANLVYSYQLPLPAFPARATLSARAELLGLGFSQGFGENYYEFYQYNSSVLSRLNLTQPLNNQGLQTRLRIDLPVWDYLTLSLGYRWQWRSWQLRHTPNRQQEHTVYVGFVSYIKPLGGRKTFQSSLPF